MKRKKMSRKTSKKLFTKTAKRIHKKNMRVMPSRGGYRL